MFKFRFKLKTKENGKSTYLNVKTKKKNGMKTRKTPTQL